MGISFDGDVISLASCIDACLLGDTSVGAVCIFFSFAGLYHCSRFCQVRSYSEADALSILLFDYVVERKAARVMEEFGLDRIEFAEFPGAGDGCAA